MTTPATNKKELADQERGELAAELLRDFDEFVKREKARPWYAKAWDKITGA